MASISSSAFTDERSTIGPFAHWVLGGILIALVAGSLFTLRTFSRSQSQIETFTIDGKERQAVVFASSAAVAGKSAPVVFVFHGHGGNAQNAARRFRVHELWPEAVVVYMQGEPGVPGITDPEGKLNGWQKNSGEVGDRDLKFFDAALERAQKKHNADPNRVYLLGHSNGGRFVNLLWNTRGEKIAALCSAAGPGGKLIETAKPKSVFIIAGEKDQLVPFQFQLASIELSRKVLRTDSSKERIDGLLHTEPGANGTELVTYIHPGGHMFPDQAVPDVISFFKRHTRQS